MRKSPLATAPRWPSSMPYRVKERMRGSLQPEEKNQATDEEADAYQPIDELSPVDKLCDRVLDCYLWWFSLILAWRAACFGYPMNSSLPSMNIAGGDRHPVLDRELRLLCYVHHPPGEVGDLSFHSFKD